MRVIPAVLFLLVVFARLPVSAQVRPEVNGGCVVSSSGTYDCEWNSETTLHRDGAVPEPKSEDGGLKQSKPSKKAESSENESDPCDKREYSNVELRECYSREKLRVNTELDALTAKIVADFRKDAREYNYVIAGCLRRAATHVAQSQSTWKTYRDQHCTAILDSYTTGSGAGTAYEACEFRLGEARLEELRATFITGEAN